MAYAYDPFDGGPLLGDFGVAVHPLSLTLTGSGAVTALVRTWSGRAPADLVLTVSGLPAAVAALLDPCEVVAGAGSTLTVSVGADTGLSTHAVTVTATCPAGRVARAYLSITVGA